MVQVLAPYSGLGINYGHTWPESRGLSDPVGCQAALDEVYSLGFRKLRWNIQLYTNADSEFNEFKAAVEMALAMGFYCIFGTHHVGASLTLTQQNGAYRDRILNIATWMHSLIVAHPAYAGRLELCVGNEDDQTVDGTTLTKTAHQTWIATTIADDIHAIDASIIVSHATHSQWMADWFSLWSSLTIKLDRISMQFYNIGLAMGWVKSCKAVFGDKFYMSEWSTYNDNGIYGRNNYSEDSAFFYDFERFFSLHRSLKIDSYYFFWTGSASFPADQGFAMKKLDGSYSPALKKILLNPLRPILVDSPLQKLSVTTKAAFFNGTSSKITLPIIVDRNGFNISLWLYNDRTVFGGNGACYPVIESIATNANYRWGLRTDPNSNGLYVYTRDTTYYYAFPSGGNSKALGRWRHYIIRFDNPNGLKVYIDTVLAFSTPSARLGVIDTGISLFNSFGAYRRGFLSNLVIDNGTEWDEDTRNDLFDHIVPSGVDGFYPLNGDAQDYSGNANHGTATAVQWKRNSPF